MAQSSYFNPRRNEIRTLERNIISYRALQMVLALHYAEEIKRVVIDAIRMTDKWRIFPAAIDAVERIPKGTPRPFEKALKIFVSEGAITSNQASEIGKLVDYRMT